MKAIKNFALLAAFILLEGCATFDYKVPPGHPIANVSFDLTTNSSAWPWARNYRIKALEDLSCTDSSKFGYDLGSLDYTDAHENLGPIKVVADTPLTFVIGYWEVNSGREGRCSYTASFTPTNGKSYLVRFSVTSQSMACNALQITDENGSQVSYKSPERSCPVLLGTSYGNKNENGRGEIIYNHRYTPPLTRF